MKRIVHSANHTNNYFSCLLEGKLTYFYLTKAQARKYMSYINKGHVVDFEIYDNKKKVNNRICWQVAYFHKIEKPQHKQALVLFDLKDIRSQMKEVLEAFKYRLFLDLEMTMPPYFKGPFEAEVIQAGFVLSNNKGEVILTDSMNIKPTKYPKISRRTEKFLGIDETYYDRADDYILFYDRLKYIIDTYNPRIIVWGKNDMIALKASYQINKVDVITTDQSFVNLLQIHKNYYNLTDDLGLFKAFELYYGKVEGQTHDAYDDALVTKQVYEALLNEMGRENV
ncbi:MAG TPA: hypothetical protein VJY66_00865 [Acholeplasma sp.]|nr:hypothetical protein [Acholeplasma sp.]